MATRQIAEKGIVMKSGVFAGFLAAVLFFGTCSPVLAEPEAAQNIGVGFLIGSPTAGISAKLSMSPVTSLNVLLGYDLYHDDVDTRLDYVWYQSFFEVPKGNLPVYYGPGVHASVGSYNRIGVNAVVGMEYQLADAPLDFFFEVAPGINVLPNTDIYLSVGLGGRFFF